jgi:hypothetical protein
MKERRKMGNGGLVAWIENAKVCREIGRKFNVQYQRIVTATRWKTTELTWQIAATPTAFPKPHLVSTQTFTPAANAKPMNAQTKMRETIG